MREPFPYESNVHLLSQLLVPDPLSREEWEAAAGRWRRDGRGESLLEWLVRSGVLEEGLLLEAAGMALGVEVLRGNQCSIVAGRSPEEQLLGNNGFLIVATGDGRRLVAGGPETRPDLAGYLGGRAANWKWVLISPLRGAEGEEGVVAEADAPAGAASYGLAEWLRELVGGLQAKGAADIHFERSGSRLAVRTHAGGRMLQAGAWEGERAHGCMRLLKRWAGLSTAADTLPQDGRIRLESGGKILSFRISHLMTVDGEGAVLRVLGMESDVRSLAALGMPGELQGILLDCVRSDPGLLLFSGPTGSGKTTTLYGLLKELAPLGLKVLSIEDPVEYEMPFAVQSGVDEAAGWSFEAAIRAYLRQDPDVILLGEMRDRESAEAACRAALTGHCVLATLHAADTGAALDRMAGWGLPAGTLAETIRLVVNQRLVQNPASGARGAVFQWLRLDAEALYRHYTLAAAAGAVSFGEQGGAQ